MTTRYGDWLQSATGRKVYPLDPRQDEIHIEDISHALSNLCRFGGHTRRFYSVAEHCCHVYDLLPWDLRRAGLLHDASEAYLMDMPRPLKRTPGFGDVYQACELALMCVIAAKFGFDWPMCPTIESVDNALLGTEARQLMAPLHPDWPIAEQPYVPGLILLCWTPEHARREFMTRYESLL